MRLTPRARAVVEFLQLLAMSTAITIVLTICAIIGTNR